MSGAKPAETIWNFPNILTLSRLPLSAILFVCIHYHLWLLSLIVFCLAAATDWLDGWWARKYNQLSTFGRTFDPLIDKVLTGGAFIFLIPVLETGFEPWMVTVVIGRELLITGIRGYIESLGKKFGADWFGKLKMILQCVVLISAFSMMYIRNLSVADELKNAITTLHYGILYAMLAATILSGLQYCSKAMKILRQP